MSDSSNNIKNENVLAITSATGNGDYTNWPGIEKPPFATTMMIGEEGDINDRPPVDEKPPYATTMALGEEGDADDRPPIDDKPPIATTMMIGEEGDINDRPPIDDKPPIATTMALGEEGDVDDRPPIDEKPPYATTMALGEEGDADVLPPEQKIPPGFERDVPDDDGVTSIELPPTDGIDLPDTGEQLIPPGFERDVPDDVLPPVTNWPEERRIGPIDNGDYTNWPGIEYPADVPTNELPRVDTDMIAHGEEGSDVIFDEPGANVEPVVTIDLGPRIIYLDDEGRATETFGEIPGSGAEISVTMALGEQGEPTEIDEKEISVTMALGEQGEPTEIDEKEISVTMALGEQGEFCDLPIEPKPKSDYEEFAGFLTNQVNKLLPDLYAKIKSALYEEYGDKMYNNYEVLFTDFTNQNFEDIYAEIKEDFYNPIFPVCDLPGPVDLPVCDLPLPRELPVELPVCDLPLPKEFPVDLPVCDLPLPKEFPVDLPVCDLPGPINFDVNVTVCPPEPKGFGLLINDVLDTALVDNEMDILIAAVSESSETFTQAPKDVDTSASLSGETFADIADITAVIPQDIV